MTSVDKNRLSKSKRAVIFVSIIIVLIVNNFCRGDIVQNSPIQALTTDEKVTNGVFYILGEAYSSRLKKLYDDVHADFKLPISFIEKTNGGDDTIEVMQSEIVINLHQGSSEDIVAHELMHAVLHHEGYPQIASFTNIPLSMMLGNLMRADLDHLVINERLQEIGYDPHNGFLRNAAGYQNVIKTHIPTDKNGKAIGEIGMIHELLKFKYYIADPTAESAILKAHPDVQPYWDELSKVINSLSSRPTPRDIWLVASTLSRVCDNICDKNNADFQFSRLLLFSPVPLDASLLEHKANEVFTGSEELMQGQGKFVWTFLKKDNAPVAFQIIFNESGSLNTDFDLTVSEFVKRRQIELLLSSDITQDHK